MPVNKNALLRYLILDKLFRNPNRDFNIIELAYKCNLELNKQGYTFSVGENQIRADIRHMMEINEFKAPIEKYRVNGVYYYRYSDRSYTINNKTLNDGEIGKLHDAISVLTKFKGIPHLEWLEKIAEDIEKLTETKTNSHAFVSFQQNPRSGGLRHFKDLVMAISGRRPLTITYLGFDQEAPTENVFSPWYMKEYNTRWFVFGQYEGRDELTVCALDRIVKIKSARKKYIENTRYDFERYFDEIIGVTVEKDEDVEEVIFRTNKKTWQYLNTKPLHKSQNELVELRENGYHYVKLRVRINYELKANLLYRGSAIKVIAPDRLVEWMREETQIMRSLYQD